VIALVGAAGQPQSDGRSGSSVGPWPRGLLLRELVGEHVASARRRPGRANVGDRRPAMTPKPRGRGKGAWWTQAVAMEWSRTLPGSQVPDGYGCLV
jgi:hypothetical protein